MAKLSAPGSGGDGSTDTSTSGSSGDRSWLRSAVLGIITSWLVGGLWQMSIRGVDIVQTVQGIYLGAFGSAGAGVLTAFRQAGDSILGVEESIATTLVQVGASSGLAGPIASAIIFTFVMVATAALVKGLLNTLKWVT